jgi:hypothetical protein
VVVCALGFSRARAGTLSLSTEAPDILAALWRSIGRLGALPATLVTAREGSLYAGGGRPSEPFARFCGQLRVGWRSCEPGDAQAKGLVERLQGSLETSFERAACSPTMSTSTSSSTAGLTSAPTGACTARCGAGVAICWQERESTRAVPESVPELDRQKRVRVPPDPYLRFDTND